MKLLIAIPVHNERKYVEQVLAKVRGYHDDVLVVDDGSTDGTSQVLAGLAQAGDLHLIRHRVNQGYGQSLIDAFAYADRQGYDWVVTMDCDEQHEPEMIPRFLEVVRSDQFDLISGSRYLRPQSADDLPPADRRSINAGVTATLNRLFGWDLTDAFCGFKAHRVSAMRRLDLTEKGYAFPLQLWPQAWAAGLRVTELAVRLIYNDLTRTFGDNLDDADRRRRHYTAVLRAELVSLRAEAEVGRLDRVPGGDNVGVPVAAAADDPVPAWSPTRLAAACECCG